jgi:hypothetical protein
MKTMLRLGLLASVGAVGFVIYLWCTIPSEGINRARCATLLGHPALPA